MSTQHTQTSTNTRTAWRPVLKPIARLLVAAQLALVLQPLSVLAQESGQAPYNPVAQAQLTRLAQLNQSIEQAKANRNKTPADHVSDKLGQAQELVAQLKSNHTPDKPAKHRQLKDLLAAIQAGVADVRAEFDVTKAQLQARNLSTEILARHEEAAAQFEQRAAGFGQIIATAASDDEKVQRLGDFFDRFPNKRKPGKNDPTKLPWSAPQPNLRAPAETRTAWFQKLYGDQKIRLAQAGGTNIGPLQFSTPPEPGQAPSLADLAETDEVQLTAAIRAKASELRNNPVEIYNWVRNNIAFAPTAGAIQSAQDTLDKKRGNATDTASLLIALLRAANIPARYQYGTIDVPAGQAMNWVGGTTVPLAALQILNQGGIAARGLASGGRIVTIRMEHVWVQAYVNWNPSRGNRNATQDQHPNPNAPLNAWVPLDASFKQYAYAPGMDLKSAVPIDVAALLDTAKQGATLNDGQGWVQNLNQAALQGYLADYQNRLKTHIESTGTGANSTVGDVIGKKIIPSRIEPLLAGTLPNPVVLQGAQVNAVPSAMQHKFTYRLYASEYDRASDTPMLAFTEKTAKLVGKRLTLTYVPATQADADTIAGYLPRRHADGSALQASELPTSLPAYLIRLKAQINLDGQVLTRSAASVQMGSDLSSTGGFTQLHDAGQWDLTSDESNVAGQTTAIGISAGGISPVQLDALRARLTAIQGQLESGVTSGLTGEEITGSLVSAAIWNWFAATDSHNRMSQNHAGMVENPGLSYGLFHIVGNPVYSWGVIRKITFPGVNMDIGHVRIVSWAKDNDEKTWIAYNRMRGQYMSALEHAIPERIFNDPARCNPEGSGTPDANLPACPQGISAVKAIALGAQAGQKIFSITPSMYAADPGLVFANLPAHSQGSKDRIQQALAAGYEVTVHEAPITQSGWTGAGFVMIDPRTGAGGYIIEGGSNGGSLDTDFAQRYLDWVCAHMITNEFVLGAVGLLSPFLPVTKALFGLRPLLGDTNPYTTVLRGLALAFLGQGLLTAVGAALGPILWLPAIVLLIFVGFFNLTILIEGLFYAGVRKRGVVGPVHAARREWRGQPAAEKAAGKKTLAPVFG